MKLIPSNLIACQNKIQHSLKNITKSSTQQHKIHYVWHLIDKIKEENMAHNQKKSNPQKPREKNQQNELAHVVIEAERSQDLQSASCRLRIANSVVPVQVQRPKNQKSQWRKFQSESQQVGDPRRQSQFLRSSLKMKRSMCQLKHSSRRSSFLHTFLFYSYFN